MPDVAIQTDAKIQCKGSTEEKLVLHLHEHVKFRRHFVTTARDIAEAGFKLINARMMFSLNLCIEHFDFESSWLALGVDAVVYATPKKKYNCYYNDLHVDIYMERDIENKTKLNRAKLTISLLKETAEEVINVSDSILRSR